MTESILEPELPIIDPHHHLWDLRPVIGAFPEPRHDFLEALVGAPYYTFDALQADTQSGHNVIATVFMECGAFYDVSRGDELKTVGEVEFVNGVAAQGASGLYGSYRPCAAIVGHADLTLGSGAGRCSTRSPAASPRFVGIRHAAAWDADPEVLGPPFHAPEGLYRDATFREGFAELGKRGLTFDAWLLEPQLGDVLDLARAFPDQPIVLDHCGTPLGIASYKGKLGEHFGRWRESIRAIAECENVTRQARRAGDGVLPAARQGTRRGARQRRTGGDVAALYRHLHRSIRPGARDVREQLPGRPLGRELSGAVERLQAARERRVGQREARPVRRHRGAGLRAGAPAFGVTFV